MKFALKPLVMLMSGMALVTLAACGGDDDDSTPVAPTPTGSISGVVIDGVLANATVCLDLNDNRACDAAEPTATTAADGKYTIDAVSDADIAAHPVLARVTAGTTTDGGAAVAASYMLASPAGKGAVVSPYTTLVQSELDSGRAPNLGQAEEDVIDNLVGTAGDVGGLTLYSNYVTDTTVGTDARRAKMAGAAPLLADGFARTMATSGLTGKAALGALGMAATGSLQQVLSQVTAVLSAADRAVLFAALQDSLVPTPAAIASATAAAAKTAAAPIEGAWLRSTVVGAATLRELYIFAGDGTFVHHVLDSGVAPVATVPSTTAFDNGYGYRYGRYTLAGGSLTTQLIEASEAAGPAEGALTNVTVTGDSLTASGGIALTRVTGGDALVGGWLRSNGSAKPEFLVMFADGTYLHSAFYYQNDPGTGTATFFETAKSVGVRRGTYVRDTANRSVVNFGETSVLFDGALAIPSNPGVGFLQADGSLSMTGLRLVKLGSVEGAKAVSGLSEATRSRIWSGRYFSRTLTVGGASRTQYVYVRGPNDVLTFLQPTAVSTALCTTNPGGTPVVDFTSVGPADGKLKQFVVGTSTAATAGYAQRRLNIGTPSSFVTYTPIARPTNATARCVFPS